MPSASTLSPASLAWRAGVMLVCVGLLLVGGLTRSNDLFPFGALDQFSSGVDPDGEVINTCLQGIRDDADPFDIRFGQGTVGIERADVESSLAAIEADPSLLAPLAAEYDRRHPDQEPLDALVLCQRITPLQDGTARGPDRLVEVARWVAP